MKVSFIYVIIFLISVLISSISQIILKLSSRKQYENKIKEYLNPMVILAYGMFFLSTLMTTLAYKGVPLSFGPILEATGYIYVAILGATILKEKMTKNKIIGNVLIIIGIIVFSL
ncbi:MAG: EamA family transporter [Clostridium sp.]|nr:EamA family transporter [Clostridium sp.]MCM1398829.1 EamA family transporter [Clostridium sp.]MCM1458539.1 EamA family transporter [Bacteroides sp.]